MKRYLSRLLSLVLVVSIGLMGCSFAPEGGLTGNYQQDAQALIGTLRATLQMPDNTPEKQANQTQTRKLINDFSARYRRDQSLTKVASYTTIRTALNSLAGHYNAYPNRPVPQKLKDRLEKEFRQAESFLERGA